MINYLLFDFGDVFINLDKEVVTRRLELLERPEDLGQLIVLNRDYECGRISSQEFLEGLQAVLPAIDYDELQTIWNSMLLDFPDYRLEFLEKLAKEGRYTLLLLSNTNDLHIRHVAQQMGESRYQRFKNCFKAFYLSHEIGLAKPDPAVFEFVLKEHGIAPREMLFIDDTPANTEAAALLGIRTWHLQPGKEDIIQLKAWL